jgi:energy-coupling factor transporter ATP-binding protein EcfA2
VLDIRELTVGFGVDGPVFAEAALEVGHGQRLLVCGAAGSGKSTLLNVAAGIIPRLVSAPVFSGTVRFLGMPMDTFERGRLFTAIGSLGQNVEEQLWDLQVEDLIAFPMENRGVARAAIRDRLHALLVDMELTDLRGRRVLTLSGGERRTAAIAAALAMPPQMLVLDEPTTGLDPAARVRQPMQIGRLAGEVPALVIAEQDPSAFEGLVDCVALLSGGKLSAPAPAAELMRAQAPCGGPRPLVSVAALRTELRRADGSPCSRT